VIRELRTLRRFWGAKSLICYAILSSSTKFMSKKTGIIQTQKRQFFPSLDFRQRYHEKHQAFQPTGFNYFRILSLFVSFYVILNGSAVVYIDPNLSGEDDRAFIQTVVETVADDRAKEKGDQENGEDGMEKAEQMEDDGEGTTPEIEKVEKKKLDRSKFGKFIVKYGKSL
jgi:hypothetical protein